MKMFTSSFFLQVQWQNCFRKPHVWLPKHAYITSYLGNKLTPKNSTICVSICRFKYVFLGYRNKETPMNKKNSCGELMPETKRQIKQEITKRLVIGENIMDDVTLNSWSITSNKKINLSISITLRKDLLNGV